MESEAGNQHYLPSARELQRLIGVCKAPIIQHFSETISGTITIRSFDQEPRFQRTNMKMMDEYSRPRFPISGAIEWLCFLTFLISIPEEF
ncbi:hypothetical protein VNO77_19774 [Canavalia gladiata]|uniref:ABC transmembrane type-1 domain-containing protein n=1 Tax=Canavalia gladiata TaxID=3824 RepID=A0AAN9LRJ4_CANGL